MNFIKNYKPILLSLSFIFCIQLIFAQDDVDLLNQEVTIAFEDLSIKETLTKLEQEVGIATAYNERELDDKKITITFEKELLKEVLNTLLSNENLSYKVIGNTVTIFRKEKEITATKPKQITKTKPTEKYTLSGYIMDTQSKETLIGASVYVSNIEKGTSSNEYGFYSLTLPEGTYEIIFSYIGYTPIKTEITLNKDTEFSPTLTLGNTLEEVIVTDDKVKLRHVESKMSSNKISMAKVKAMPVLMGEKDVLKIVQLMPGIQSGSEGSTGLYVRGGGADQNLMLLDGVPIYNVNHLLGFLSTFNGDAIKSAEIIKGGFPARYGGRLSSILDVRMKEGDMKEFHGDFSVGLISGKINLEGPIKKDKTSFSFSSRRTWFDLFTTPIQKSQKRQNGETYFFAYHFYDVNAKINHKFSDKSRLYLSTYIGNDKITDEVIGADFKDNTNLKWGNRIYSARWNYQINPKLFSNTTLYYSRYKFGFRANQTQNPGTTNSNSSLFTTNSTIEDYGGKIDFDFLPNPNHYVRFGLGSVLHQFTPTVNYEKYQEGNEPPIVSTQGDEKVDATEITAYVEDDMALGQKVRLNLGVHFAHINVQNKNYNSLQPRASLSYLLNEKSSLKFSYAQMTQPLHLLASPGLGFPTDLWVPSTEKVKPERSIQYAIGYTRSLSKGFELTVEGYYKTMSNLLEYKSGFNIFSNSKDWEEKVLVGEGVSYGIEFLFEKKIGKTTGWLGYTLSRSYRTFPDIDNGKTFPYKYDRRHDIGLAITHKKNDRMDFGIVWVYGTGNTYTLGTKNYNAITAGTETVFAEGIFSTLLPVNHIENRNNQRAPAYHRLDLSVNLHKEKKRGIRSWSFGLYNAYSRQNPFIVQLIQKENDILRLEQTSLLPILPYVAYSFKF